MKHLILVFLLGMSWSITAQPDLLPTENGDIKLTPILHSTLVLEWNGKTIFIDPYGGGEKFTSFGKPDLVIITDIHGDHMNKETLGAFNLDRTTLVAPKEVMEGVEELTFEKIIVMPNGSKIRWGGIQLEAIPMYNLPETEDSRHPKGRGNGYVLTIGGKRLYISGDTEDIAEMRQLKDIDYAFVCMNLPFTMTVEQAADAVLEFKPKVIYPFHYRGRDGLADVGKFKELVNAGNADIEVRLRNWYPEN